MSRTLRPRLDILPASQRRLWAELADLPSSYVLYGGTAIALHLGHRDSIDFDFFIAESIDPRRLLDTLPILRGAIVTQMEPDTLSVIVDRDGPVKLSFFGVPKLGQVRPPLRAEDNGLAVADILDLGGAKVSVVQVRIEPKDYIDVAALLGAGTTLPDMLAAGLVLYGSSFAPQSALKALAHFEEPGLTDLPFALKDRLQKAVRAVDLDALPNLHPVQPRAEVI
ncbi:nucleotidyl transferase AbiEii/AbiGii toxin family protein [Brevundimonas sp.]|uniref:nucleotidyl transferase AbiEii/AbiGii toxin family protein n=1 Tax=Brevundimonas sp. TaxID=1871086 RepID=UPI001A1D6D58|nr:nucleotidyl transferase AbiEii/AbiGii toxin family protein [Brevundimonas sp.]MBJ7486581.1 nucleotidyl transferase AbiEii/AbiGii toxin family protein [Brevundimonas sp.]